MSSHLLNAQDIAIVLGLVQSPSNQIYLVTLRPTQLTQATFLQKKMNVANGFLISDI